MLFSTIVAYRINTITPVGANLLQLTWNSISGGFVHRRSFVQFGELGAGTNCHRRRCFCRQRDRRDNQAARVFPREKTLIEGRNRRGANQRFVSTPNC
jgi:hypothetical protein